VGDGGQWYSVKRVEEIMREIKEIVEPFVRHENPPRDIPVEHAERVLRIIDIHIK
jgi:hypothetical protein